MLRHDPEVTSADTLPYVVVDRDTVGLPAQEAIKMTELKSALRDRGLSEKLFVTDAGPVIVVKGRKGEMLCLITESGFDVDEWADSIKAELS